MSRAFLDVDREVVLLNAVTTIAFPATASDGADIKQWRDLALTKDATGQLGGVNAGHVDAAIFLSSSAAQTLSGGLGLYGWRKKTALTPAQWYLLGSLNNGVAIATLGAATGFSQIIEAASVFDRLAIGPLTSASVTPGSGTVTFTACQIQLAEDMRV